MTDNIKPPLRFQCTEKCVDALLDKLGKRIVLGLPLGLGKANHFTNALYARAAADPSIDLTIFTALTLERPSAKGEIQRRFVQPLLDRLYNQYQDLNYTPARRKGLLPANIKVCEFYLQPGSYLHNGIVQQNYISANYTHVIRDLLDRGVNVLAQMVAPDPSGSTDLSLSCNSDLTLPLLPLLESKIDYPFVLLGEVNPQLPFLEGDARLTRNKFNFILEGKDFDTPLFPIPGTPVNFTEYALAFHITSMIADGGTLQIGIGALGDAICHTLILRQHHNQHYLDILSALIFDDSLSLRHRLPLQQKPFVQGLYGVSEMVVEGFLHLRKQGILTRKVYADEVVQTLLNRAEITAEVNEKLLQALHQAGRINCPLTEQDTNFLQHLGIVDPNYSWRGHRFLDRHGEQEECDLHSSQGRNKLLGCCAGQKILGGTWLHGGFYVGSNAFYQALRELPKNERAGLNMTAIDYINDLQQQRALKTAQRSKARFVNSAMLATLNGAIVSDGLADGQVVSGVGGQYNFVAQAHELEDGRSIIALPSTRMRNGVVNSNIVWEYPHTTIPRHLRDIVITEYGAANLRGKTDREVITAMLCIADSRFQPSLMKKAKKAGKLEPGYTIPLAFTRNSPERIAALFSTPQRLQLLPYYPLGCDFTDEEALLAIALSALKNKGTKLSVLVPLILAGRKACKNRSPNCAYIHPCLQRMEMEQAQTYEHRLESYTVAGALSAYVDRRRPLRAG